MAGAGAMRSWKLTQFKAPLAETIESPPSPVARASSSAGQRLRRLP